MALNDKLARISLAGGMTLALLIGMSAAASAQDVTIVQERPADDQLTEYVSYADLQLATRHGERVLNGRVREASRRVCAPQKEMFDNLGCRRFALKGARPQIALAVARAREIAANGTSSIAPVAIVIATPQ